MTKNGNLDPVMAFTLKKIRVDGDLGKALLLKEVVGRRRQRRKLRRRRLKSKRPIDSGKEMRHDQHS